MNIKRVLAIVLSVIMVMTLLPIAAFAEGETPEAGSTTVNGLSIAQSGSVLMIEKDGTAEGATYVCDGAIWASIANVNPSEITEIQVGEGVVLGENAFSGFAALQAVKLTGTIGGDGENATLPNQIAATAFAGLSSVDVVYWYFAEDEEHVVKDANYWDAYMDPDGLDIIDNYGAEQINWINLPVIGELEHYNSMVFGPNEKGEKRWSLVTTTTGYYSYVLTAEQCLYGSDSVDSHLTISHSIPEGNDKAVFDKIVDQIWDLHIIELKESFSFEIEATSSLENVGFINCSEIKITNSGSEPLDLQVQDTKITVIGDVETLTLASSPSSFSDITVTGDVENVNWNSPTYSQPYEVYGGSLHVGGVVKNGIAYDGIEEEYVGVGKIIVNTIGRRFSNVTGDIISSGELTCDYEEIKYTPSQEYQYTYYCQSTGDYSEYLWSLGIYNGETNTRLELYSGKEADNNMFDSFSVDNIYYLPGGRTSLYVTDTNYFMNSEPLVINVPDGEVLGSLTVPCGNVEVHGDVTRIVADGIYYRNDYLYPAISLLIDGNVDDLEISGRCKHASITMTAGSKIVHGSRMYPSILNMEDRFFGNIEASEDNSIMNDGTLNVFAYSNNDDFGLILPSMETVGAAAGVGNDEFASVVVNNSSEGALTEAEKTALETAIGDAEAYVVAVVNMNVNEYSENGEYLGSVSKLSDQVGIQYDFDTVGNLTAIDLHNSDGTIVASTVGEADSGETLTITTSEFSSFVILSDNAEDLSNTEESADPYDWRNREGLPTIEEFEHYLNIAYTVDDGDAYWELKSVSSLHPDYKVRVDQLIELLPQMTLKNEIEFRGGVPVGAAYDWFESICSEFMVFSAHGVEMTFTVPASVEAYFVNAYEGSKLTVNNSNDIPLSLMNHNSQVQVNGNVEFLQFMYNDDEDANVNVNGDVERMDWYTPGTLSSYRYDGSVSVSGTLVQGNVYRLTEVPVDPDLGIKKPISVDMLMEIFDHVSGQIIEKGVAVAETKEPEKSENEEFIYRYQVTTLDTESGKVAYWMLSIVDELGSFTDITLDGSTNGENYFPGFTAADIMSGNNVSVLINNTDFLPQGEKLVISADVSLVLVNTGIVEVAGKVGELNVNSNTNYGDPGTIYPNMDLMISGQAEQLVIYGRCKGMEITLSENGSVANGIRNYPECMGMSPRTFANVNAAQVPVLMDNGTLKVASYNANDNFGLILPSMDEVGQIVGTSEGTFASVVVNNRSEGQLTDNEKAALEELIGNEEAYIVAVVNMDVNKYTEDGDYLGSETELKDSVDIQYDFDTVGNLTAIDLHNSDGTIEASNVGEATSGETLTITTSEFSNFVILSDNITDKAGEVIPPIIPVNPDAFYEVNGSEGLLGMVKTLEKYTYHVNTGSELVSMGTPEGMMLYIREVREENGVTIIDFSETNKNIVYEMPSGVFGIHETEIGLELVVIPAICLEWLSDTVVAEPDIIIPVVENDYIDFPVVTQEDPNLFWMYGDTPMCPINESGEVSYILSTSEEYTLVSAQNPVLLSIEPGRCVMKAEKDAQGNYTLILLAIDYQIIEGANGTWDEADETAEEGLLIRSDAPYADFVRVEMDGEIVDPSNYDVSEGSTIVVFHKDFLEKLPEGKHTVSIISKNGSATTAINIVQKAEEKEDTTPDDSSDSSTPDESKPSDDSSKPSEESGEPNNSSKPEESKTEEAKPAESQPAESKPAENSSSTTETKEPAPVTSNKPDTGDRANTTAWAMCLLISMVGMLVVGKYGKKRTN